MILCLVSSRQPFSAFVFKINLNKMTSSDNSRKTATFTLVIEKFSQLTAYRETSFCIDNVKLRFGLFPKIDMSGFQNGNSFVYCCNDGGNTLTQNVHLKVSIVNSKNEKLYTRDYILKIDKCKDNSISKFGVRADLLDDKNGYLANDKLIVLCEAELIADNQINSMQSNTSKLVEDYEALLRNGDNSDATLVIGEKEFRVHKTILAARSPVLGVMFKHEQTSEARLNRVDIIDVEVDVFEQLIRYIYTGKVDGLDRFAVELMAAADKYQVNSLKDVCEEYLCSNLVTESVANVLLMADLHRAAELRSKCIDYIAKNVREVKATDGWKLLVTKNEMLIEILLHLSDEYKSIA